ncbi:murein biosynthesis integral membrane protein MurJ [bacterium]|nr:murein biosynthesis integral membrane protein MurJ [bacterium]
MIARFLNSKAKTVTFAAILLAISALISRVLGVFRDNLLANLFSKQQTDIYFAAFRIPDFVYGILITGGVVAAFLPIFSEYFKKNKIEAQTLTNNVLTFFLLFLIFFCSLLAIFTPQLVRIIVPGFSPYQKELVVSLTRIMFLSPILLGISAIFSGILQYFSLFFALALAPIFYNIGIIIGILFLAPRFGLKGLALGVGLGALFHLAIQIPPLLKSGFRFKPSFNFKHQGLQKIFKLMLPRILGSATFHINLIVITAIASTLVPGSLSCFNFANNLRGVPIGLIGIPFATATFPALARTFAEKKKREFLKSFSDIFSRILFLIIPLSFLIFLLREQIVRIILGTSILNEGKFTWWETKLTAGALGIFTIGLFAASLIPLLVRAFFALRDTKTPVKIAVLCMVLNITFCFLFVNLLKTSDIFENFISNLLNLTQIKNISVLGLPLALSLSSIFQFSLLFLFLKKKIKPRSPRFAGKAGSSWERVEQEILSSLKKVLLATLLTVISTFLWLQISSSFFNLRTFLGVFSQVLSSLFIGGTVYFILSLLFKSKEPKIIWLSIKNQFTGGDSL